MSWGIIKDYINAGGCYIFVIVLAFYIVVVTSQVLTNIWLSDWTEDTVQNITHQQQNVRLGVYGGLGGVQGEN